MHSSTHGGDDLDLLSDVLDWETFLVCSRAWILTTDPPRDVDIEEGEDGN